MDYTVVIRQRTLRCLDDVHKRLMLGISNPGMLEHKDALVLRPMPFEKTLLEKVLTDSPTLQSVNASENSAKISSLTRFIFLRWSWAFDVLRQFLTDLHPDNVQKPHVGTLNKALENALSMLRAKRVRRLVNLRSKRTKYLLEDNPHLKSGPNIEITYEKINVKPHPDDIRIWELLAVVYSKNLYDSHMWIGFRAVESDLLAFISIRNPPTEAPTEDVCSGEKAMSEAAAGSSVDKASSEAQVEQISDEEQTDEQDWEEMIVQDVDLLIDSEDTWDVWKVYRSMRLAQLRLSNEQDLDVVFKSREFSKNWKLVRFQDNKSDVELKGYFSTQPFAEKLRAESSDFFQSGFSERLSLAYRQRLHQFALEPMHHYLEFIPFTELTTVDIALAKGSFKALSVEPEDFKGAAVMAWKPSGISQVNHLLFVTEDVYAHFLEPNFVLPGYKLDESVLFLMTPIGDTKFSPDIQHFWATWNDCAVTFNPSDQEVYLLETLPGRKSRSLPDSFQHEAIQKYIQSIIRMQGNAEGNARLVKELLGPQYHPSFDHFLRYIDPSDLTLRPEDLIGKGSYGRAYKARCKNLPSDTTDFDDLREGFVALKIAFNASPNQSAASSKFFQELRLLHLALLGSSLGFVEFYGFTQVQVDETGRLCSKTSGGEQAFALVFEYAEAGPSLEFLENQLQPGKFQENWLTVCASMNSLALGLSSIHAQGVLHRDIHPNNVLVKPQDSGADQYYNFLLADLGEGKTIQAAVQAQDGIVHSGKKVVNITTYVAPEIITAGFSTASDVYAYARTCLDMIRFNSQCLSTDRDGAEKLLVPTKLLGMLRLCTSRKPEERLEARFLSIMLDEVEKDIRRLQGTWFEDYDFDMATKPNSGDTSLPSSFGES